MPRTYAAALSMLILVLSGAPLVRADTAAVLPIIGGSAQIPDAVRVEVRETIASALRTEEWTVLDPDTARRRLGALASCAPDPSAPGPTCAVRARDALDVDAVAGVSIEGTQERPEIPARITVQLTGIDGVPYAGSARVSTSPSSAARAALREALSRRALGTGPFLTVRGTVGASCVVDDEEVGTVPLTIRVDPGSHRVLIRLEGHEPQERTVVIEASALATESIEVTLEPTLEDATPVAPVTRTEPLVAANLGIGIALAVGGLAALISPIHTLSRLGECVDDRLRPEGCETEIAFGAQSGVLMGVGALALIGSIVFLVVQPITVTVQASAEGASLHVRGSF